MIGYLDPDIVNQCFGEYPNPLFRMEDNFVKEPLKKFNMLHSKIEWTDTTWNPVYSMRKIGKNKSGNFLDGKQYLNFPTIKNQ